MIPFPVHTDSGEQIVTAITFMGTALALRYTLVLILLMLVTGVQTTVV
jgi:hypothetical protein